MALFYLLTLFFIQIPFDITPPPPLPPLIALMTLYFGRKPEKTNMDMESKRAQQLHIVFALLPRVVFSKHHRYEWCLNRCTLFSVCYKTLHL